VQRSVPRDLIGRSRCIREVRERVETLARGNLPLLIRGETGTGKELVARLIHQRSARSAGPFVPVNCAAIPEPLLESELFGHEKGAFTGALARRRGRLEQASGGTLFLDEIGDMSITIQAKLLRALESAEIERLGGESRTRVDVRFVAATHHDLETMRKSGTFRDDLFYRLAGAEIKLPSLRDRGDDLDLLAEHFISTAAPRLGLKPRVTRDFVAAIRAYPWPGNVREFLYALEVALQLSEDGTLRVEDLPERVREVRSATRAESAADQPLSCTLPTLAEIELAHIRRVVEIAGGNKTEAARILGVGRSTVMRRLRDGS
jgi:two-component system, NtrC family, response regulator AtoC